MGDEYIKRRDVLIKLEIAYDMARADQKLPISDLQHEVNLIKATDMLPVKHGRWIFDGWSIQCDQCRERYKYGLRKRNFCPNCGARMDAKPDEPWQSE